MSQINRPPLGLQNLLGSQNFGDNPRELAGAVAPTLDMMSFYGSGILRMRRISGALATEGEIAQYEFDDRVALLSLAGWQQAGASGAHTCQLGLAISGPPNESLPVDQPHQLAQTFPFAHTGTSQPVACYTFPTPLVVEAGTKVHLYWLTNPGNVNSVQMTILFYDLSQP